MRMYTAQGTLTKCKSMMSLLFALPVTSAACSCTNKLIIYTLSKIVIPHVVDKQVPVEPVTIIHFIQCERKVLLLIEVIVVYLFAIVYIQPNKRNVLILAPRICKRRIGIALKLLRCFVECSSLLRCWCGG